MADGKHILIVDDEPDLAELVELNLQRAGYQTTVAHDGRSALASAQKRRPDLIVLDVMMPELSGTEVAGRLRSNPATSAIPIVMLTAKAEEVDELVGLTVGADDYITKPFSVKVLIARIEAVLRRANGKGIDQDGEGVLRLGPVQVNLETHDVAVDGKIVKLTLTEFKLLSALIAADGKVLNRNILMGHAMGPGVTVTERTIDVHVTSIRKKLGDHANILQTVRGVGYRATLSEPTEA